MVSDADVEAVVLGAEGVLAGMRGRRRSAIHSTMHPETCLRTGRSSSCSSASASLMLPSAGEAWLRPSTDSSSWAAVRNRTFDVCRPVFETFGNPVIHLGPLGSGELAKLLNNLVFVAHLGAALETFSSAQKRLV